MAEPQLKQAYTLIKSGNKSEAIKLIKPVLQSNRDNAAAWWLLANAVNSPDHARQALQNVLRLRPDDERAQAMLAKLNGGSTTVRREAPPASLPQSARRAPAQSAAADPFAVLDDEDDDPFDDPFEDPFEDPFAAASAPSRSASFDASDPFAGIPGLPVGTPGSAGKTNQMIVYGIVAVAVLIVIGLGAVIALTMGGDDGDGLPSVAANCDVGAGGSFGSQSIIDCSTIAMDGRTSGTLREYQTHRWRFSGTQGQRVIITADATDGIMDTVLTLDDPEGFTLTSNDDGGEGYNSRIEMTLPHTGTYTVEVTDFSDDGGAYVLYVRDGGGGVDVAAGGSSGGSSGGSAQGDSAAYCDVGSGGGNWDNIISVNCGSLDIGQRVTGRVNDYEHHDWFFQAQAGQQVTIALDEIDGDMDPMLILYGPRGEQIAQDDDGGNYLNSRLTIQLPASGTYRVEVMEYGDWGGSYALTVSD